MKSVIFGLKGTSLTNQEKTFFRRVNPVGFILFARNLESVPQIENLILELKQLVGRENIPILIDQEGGRVQRIGPLLGYNKYPAADIFSKIAETNLNVAEELCRINYQLIGMDLRELGITVNCAPCIDLLHPSASKVIGDRSFGNDPKIVAALGQSAIYGLKEAGIMPIIKHIPGHGRALVDSHHILPHVSVNVETLENDISPFKDLAIHAEIAMTAHILFTAIDSKHPLTLSKKGINFIRENIGFNGVIISDDLSMKALTGTLDNIARKAFKAGCDLLLHCNGNLAEMEQIASNDLPVNQRVNDTFIKDENKLIQVINNKILEVDKELLLAKLIEKTGFEYGRA